MNWQPVSVSIVAYDGHPLDVALTSLARLNVSCVEMAYIEGYSDNFDEALFDVRNAAHVRQALDAAGVACRALSAHFDLSRAGGDVSLARRIEFGAALGARMVATVSGPRIRKDDFLANLERAVRIAEATGVIIGLENPADDSVATIDNGADAARIVAEFSHPLVRVNYDPGNFLTHVPGSPPQEDLVPALPWCAGIHLKDLRPTTDGYVHTALGAGTVDWDKFFDVVAQKNEPPLLSIEHPLRMRRDARGRIVLDAAVLPLPEVEAVIAQSLQLVQEQIARHENR